MYMAIKSYGCIQERHMRRQILKRNGRMVAERMDNSDSWQLVGDYKKPLFQHCAPPWQSCQIDDYFKGYYIIAP